MTPIEQKLYEFYNSSDYRTLERAISESNLSFSQLPEKLKLTSLFLHQNGQDGVITDMWRLFHKFEPPVLSDYMTNPKVGGSIVDNIYTGWKKHIIPDYSDGKHPQEIVFTGAIGTGKSTLSIFLQLWNLVRVCSLINPQATLNVTSNTLLVLALFTVTLEKASLALIKPFIAALEDSPYFAQVDKEAEFNDYRGKPIIPYLSRRGVVEFPNNIIINIGSTVNHAISYSMFGAMLDEAEFGCFTGDTLVRTTTGDYPIKDLVDKEFYVYSYNHNLGKISIEKATKCFKTKTAKLITKVHLDNGEVIECTPDHRFMLRNGEYKEAANLEIGESLMPHYVRTHDMRGVNKEYNQSYCVGSEKWVFDHHLADEYNIREGVYSGKKWNFHRHHVNFNRFDNSPPNIVRLSPEAHLELHKTHAHSIVPEVNRKRWTENREACIEMSRLGGAAACNKVLNNKEHENFEQIKSKRDSAVREAISKDHEGYAERARKQAFETKKRKAEEIKQIISDNGMDWVDWENSIKKLIYSGVIPCQRARKKTSKGYKSNGWAYPNWVKWNYVKDCFIVNHKVIKIETVEKVCDVFDITVPSTSNFALSSGVFVHNSAGPEHAFSLYTNLRERVRSRFLGSKFTLLTLISSARYSQGIIADFVNSISPDDTFTKIYSFPIWEIKHFNAYKDGGKFYVLVGNSNNPHRILSVVEQQSHDTGKFVVPQNCKVIQVPEVYRKDFEGSRISEALQNLAGEAVLFTSTYIFQDLDKIEYEELVPEVEIVVELGNSTRVIDLMPDRLFETTMNGKRFKIAPSAERFIHFDLATVNEAGIACVHIETNKDKFVYVADFVIKVKAEAKIDLAALRNFAEDLSKICYLKKLTTDQYESALFRQELTVKEVADKVEILSTIKTTEPYTTLSRLAYNSQLCVGKAPELKKQLTNTQVVNGKILLESHGRSHGDMADAICGAVYSCVMDIDSHQRIQYDVSSWKNSELVTVDSVAFKLKDWLEI